MEGGESEEQIAPQNSETSSDSNMVIASAEVEFSGPLPPQRFCKGTRTLFQVRQIGFWRWTRGRANTASNWRKRL